MGRLYNVPTADFVQKTLNAELLEGVTAAATLNNVTNIPNLPGVMIIDRVTANNVETPDKVEVVPYTATSGSTATSLTRGAAGTSDQDHAVGAIVEFGPDILWAQAILDAMANLVDTATGLPLYTTNIMKPTAPYVAVGSDATGDMYFRGVGGTLSRLELGTSGQVLTANASLPYWGTLPAGDSRSWIDFADDTDIYLNFASGKKFKGTIVPSGVRNFHATNASVGDVAMLRIGYASTASIAINIFSTNSSVSWTDATVPTWTRTVGKADTFGFVVLATLPRFDGFTVGQGNGI